ncbi:MULTISPECIES: hypothetical protein [Streptomyces]|uniref:hypothetical protein n=1 Tax=Streptomyces TaxID=1883 RepID=UPI001319D947|nr:MULTISPECIES: hypothetical protein [Streptomyces]MYT03801.1 hypothetical protein [Streptomyces sp. SID5470]
MSLRDMPEKQRRHALELLAVFRLDSVSRTTSPFRGSPNGPKPGYGQNSANSSVTRIKVRATWIGRDASLMP